MSLKQKIIFVSLTCLMAVLLCVPAKSAAQQGKKPQGVKTIVIDAGHGGKDAGACYGKGAAMVKEKDIVLDVALQLGEMVKKNLPDVKVVYTREKDVYPELWERSALANKVDADLFVSIHVNSVDGKAPSGVETFVMAAKNEEGSLKTVMRENDVVLYEKDYEEKYQGYVPGSPESYIIFSLMQYVNLDQSIDFASMIQKQYVKNLSLHDRGVRRGSLLVLWTTKMPAVLTEIGFLPNDGDRKLMTSKEGKKKIVTSLFNAISEYKAKVEGNTKPLQLSIEASADDAGAGSTTTTAAKPASNIVYRIQVCTSPTKVANSNATLRPYKGEVITERKAGKVYKYFVGECHTYQEASAKQAEVRKTTKDAFMVAFEGDKQISVSDARKKE